LAAVVLGCAAQGQTLPQPPHALPALGLAGSMPQAADFDQPFEAPLPVRLRTPEGRQRVELRDCRAWLTQRAQATGSDNDNTWQIVKLQTVPCEAMALLQAAQPPAHSALPDEPPHRPLLTARYPAALWPAPSDDEQRRLAQPGQTLARASGQQHWERLPLPVVPGAALPSEGERLTLRGRGWRITLTLLARGDFDRDGWEDAAYLWEAQSQRGSASDARLVVLTRRAAGQPLRLVPIEPLLAAGGWSAR
jgi:hypothetical protein